jgi:uncharacterized protein involved in type VI secretion and phage assembly
VKVNLQPEGVETGWLPYLSPWAGPGWGVMATPAQGNQVLVVFHDGNIEAGVAIGGSFSDVDQPPSVAPDTAGGELYLVHGQGQQVALKNDGSISILGSDGQSIVMDASGNITSKGTWTHTGTFTATAEITALSQGHQVGLGQIRDLYDAHEHPIAGPQTGVPFTQE